MIQMRVRLVRAGDRALVALQLLIRVNRNRQPDRPGESDRRAGHARNRRVVGQRKRLRAERPVQLDFVHLAVAGDQDGHGIAVRHVNQRLDQTRGRRLEEVGNLLDGPPVRGRNDFRLFLRAVENHRAARHAFGALEVRGVRTLAALDQAVLAGIRKHHEFVRRTAAHRAGVGLDDLRPEAAPLEDALVGLVHRLVALLRAVPVDVEAVGVLHDEFLGAHEAEARADFIAELGLDLVEVDRELAVGIDLVRDEVGDDFLVRRAEDHLPILPVLDLEHHVFSTSKRPVFSQISGGCRAGMRTSRAPARSISSRTICSTFFSERKPSGRNV